MKLPGNILEFLSLSRTYCFDWSCCLCGSSFFIGVRYDASKRHSLASHCWGKVGSSSAILNDYNFCNPLISNYQ